MTVTSSVDSHPLEEITVTVNVVVSVSTVVVTTFWFASPSIMSAGDQEYVAPAISGVCSIVLDPSHSCGSSAIAWTVGREFTVTSTWSVLIVPSPSVTVNVNSWVSSNRVVVTVGVVLSPSMYSEGPHA